MNSRALIRWSELHDRRQGRTWWRWGAASIAGAALAAFVAWRGSDAGPTAASHAWLAGTICAFALAFLRVPFHLYWRADASLLAQLPLPGRALFDAAFVRCVRAAAATTLAAAIGVIPLASGAPWNRGGHLALHHAALACVLGVIAACFLPAVATWAAMLVVAGRTDRGTRAINVATALATGNASRAAHAATTKSTGSAGTILGALPGFASSIVIVLTIAVAPWLDGSLTTREVAPYLAVAVLASLAAIAAVRAAANRTMGTILRDVSALDRQRLAPLEIHPPTAIERAVARLLGEAGLPYRKDARLMRRRYPMAFALGALAFVVLMIVGLSRPDDPMPWLVATLAGAALYAAALTGRLRRPPIELPRLAATLPISVRARDTAKVAWTIVWLGVFIAGPAIFAIARLR